MLILTIWTSASIVCSYHFHIFLLESMSFYAGSSLNVFDTISLVCIVMHMHCIVVCHFTLFIGYVV